ncbi:MAG: efflux RND transporter periplasmic adaptor subunit [Saprospiraceae bacterium]|jgi:RND family efflux transporter MFP subunit|nr:efflux RND transporter periplasmic adaptor subunit [Saprospiraceae bacterium]MBK6479660.1 efflux RND transporter periplasmic adaptor subunit [Saprospiraceae bacterium]MBK6815370.1 efflux RND transporter periplasmic adaptor subunit [Saprospiraceae bacterium]MBK7372410.1 efflux RND transporter periplasmic adaptor subunit [Saprospiraceae bacterium]MBK7439039.1 efflux RND transporter periplasmic adaptor subunit [Saprospiraceae bacterium]
MKNIFSLLVLAISIIYMVSCKSKDAADPSMDKQAKLTTLKTQIATLEKEANALEAELNPAGKTVRTKLVGVTTFPQSTFKNYIDLQGAVTADQDLFVNSKMAGTATQILIKTGDRVTRGQTLVHLDDALIQQGLAELETQLAFATNLYDKQKALWDQKLGTEVQYLGAKNNKESIEKRIATTKEQWQMSKVTAPISGVIDEVMIKPGQMISPGIPIARLVNFSKLKITAEVPESYAGRIKPGNAIKIYFPDIQKEFDSRITYVSPIINQVNRTFKAEAALPANMNGVLPNMISIIKILDYSNDKAFILPINLLQKDHEGDFVMVADSTTEGWISGKQPVSIGRYYNDQVEIKSGINPNQQVITLGYQDLVAGEKLRLQPN